MGWNHEPSNEIRLFRIDFANVMPQQRSWSFYVFEDWKFRPDHDGIPSMYELTALL